MERRRSLAAINAITLLHMSQQCACALGADAFSRSLWTSDQSVLDFVSKEPNSTNFLFLAYDCAPRAALAPVHRRACSAPARA